MSIIIIKLKYNNKNNKKIKKIIKKKGYASIITNKKKKILNSNKIIISSDLSLNKYKKIIKKYNKYIYNKKKILTISTASFYLCNKYKKNKLLNIYKDIYIDKQKKKIGKKYIYHNNDEKIFYNLPKNKFKQKFNNKYKIKLGKYSIAHINEKICYSAALKKKNIYSLFFNPEYSGYYGEKIIDNFINL